MIDFKKLYKINNIFFRSYNILLNFCKNLKHKKNIFQKYIINKQRIDRDII